MGKNKGLNFHKDNYWQSASYNTNVYLMLETQIVNMALTRFKWVNLPETCDARYLEMQLLNSGIATISIDPQGKWRSLQVGGWQQAPDMYGNPTIWRSLGDNGYQYTTTKASGIYVWDNHLRTPIMPRITIWARELVDILRTMQQNRAHMKVPVIISGIQDKKLDMTNYVKQISGGEAFILATDGISNLNVQALKTDMPSYLTELWASYFNVWNQIYSALGIGNLPFKAERRIEDEVESQNDPTSLVALDSLVMRRNACDYLNEHFADQLPNGPLNVVWQSDNATANYNLLHNLETLLELNTDTEPDNIEPEGVQNGGDTIRAERTDA